MLSGERSARSARLSSKDRQCGQKSDPPSPSRSLRALGIIQEVQPTFTSLRRDSPESFRGWRRGELNPCPRRYPRKHLHVYPVRFLRSRRCTSTLPTPERPRISFTVRRGRSAVRLACCPRLAP